LVVSPGPVLSQHPEPAEGPAGFARRRGREFSQGWATHEAHL
jgi:hypothetical protein